MAREDIVYDLAPLRVNVGTGASIFIGITAVPGQLDVRLLYISGGTLEITNAAMGVGPGAGWPVPATGVLHFECAGTFYLSSSGATSVVGILRGRAQGFEGATTGSFGGP